MLKVKRDDFYELNNDDGSFNLDDVNNLFAQIQDKHGDDNNDDNEDEEE